MLITKIDHSTCLYTSGDAVQSKVIQSLYPFLQQVHPSCYSWTSKSERRTPDPSWTHSFDWRNIQGPGWPLRKYKLFVNTCGVWTGCCLVERLYQSSVSRGQNLDTENRWGIRVPKSLPKVTWKPASQKPELKLLCVYTTSVGLDVNGKPTHETKKLYSWSQRVTVQHDTGCSKEEKTWSGW